jgi:vancomycin resistance protein YoaR
LSVESPPSAARPGTSLPPLEAPGRAALARAWNNQRIGLVLLGVAGVLLILVGLALTERIVEDGHVLNGVQIGDVDASGMSEEDALAAVQTTSARLESTPITVRAGGSDLSVDPTALGLQVDAEASVRAAREAGRSRNPVDQLSGAVLRRFRPDTVPLVVKVDPGRFDAVLDAWVAQTGKGLVDGSLKFEGTRVVEVPPKSGIGIQRDETKAQVLAALGAGKSNAGTLQIGPTTPAVDEDDVQAAARQARAVLSAPVTFTVNGTPITMTPDQVATTLKTEIVQSKLVLRSDAAMLRAILGPTLSKLEVAPVDATFAINGTAVSVVPAVIGKLVDLEKVGDQIAHGKHAFAAVTSDVNPARTTEWAQKLNITELVSSFTTYHKVGQPRVTNIHRAADVINNTIVLPGETFSLNNALGQRTAAKGYVAAPQIGADLEDEDVIGGGVSQVSTTLFNATFFGCYQDVTHTVHALYLSRYPMGREATLNYPSIDNQWKNDSASAVLIKTSYSSGSITVSYYGNKGGRSCKAEGPHILERIPPETVTVDDPTLPAGTSKVTKSGETGYVVENFRIISTPGQPDKRERYVERYAATKTQVNRGTGGAPATAPTTPAVPAG